ncbi:MAG: type II/IV secretion system protein [Betaproteobacteria bacterium]|nr:type II/IV secretion system protein [Betaproteobacteria bacterium]
MISAADLEIARGKEGRLVENLESQLACAPSEFVRRLAETLRLPAATLEDLRGAQPAFDALSYAECSRRGCVAFRSPQGALGVALGDPYDLDSQEWLESHVRESFSYFVAHRLDVATYLSEQEQGFRALDGIAFDSQNQNQTEKTQEISFERAAEEDSPVVRLVTSTLYDALKAGASDVHLESTASGLTIKYRIDGVLTPAEQVPGTELAEQVVSRIKVMSELDIAERRVPQDGRFKARLSRGAATDPGRDIDFRVSIMPSVFGEDAVLRILDRRALSDQMTGLTLDVLGFSSEMKSQLRVLSALPYGMMLVTGPTGSGKTTTLYALISETNRGEDKFITIEDPVEYQLPGVLQIPVNEQKGLTFARGLRSILRHDPDRIMVGEIRDPETAEIAVQSALTGHLVYTTVHANNSLDVLGRFQHMGVDTYNFVSALNCVLAQRLVRTFCKTCMGKGCADCRGTGFKGRRAIGELLVMNDELRELIVARAPARKLKEAARGAGTVPLREAALALVDAGETTLEEINRVTFVA